MLYFNLKNYFSKKQNKTQKDGVSELNPQMSRKIIDFSFLIDKTKLQPGNKSLCLTHSITVILEKNIPVLYPFSKGLSLIHRFQKSNNFL